MDVQLKKRYFYDGGQKVLQIFLLIGRKIVGMQN